MNDQLKIETILGYVANTNPLRASKGGEQYEGIIPAPTWTEETVKRNGTVTDTVKEMQKIIRHYAYQAAGVAPMLKGHDLYSTCRNIWNFLFRHIKYMEDEEGQEQLRTFARSWAQRRSRGIDCDDFSIACGCILYNLNIPFYIRIARYAGKDYFQHVYPVVPFRGKQYITIDAVLDQYDAEKEPVETKDFLVMNTSNLNGIDISVLGGVEDDTLNELSGILSGADFEEVNTVEGLGQVATEEQGLNAIRNHLLRTRRIVAARPDLIRETEHPESFLGMVDYALKYWDTNKRDEALGVLAGEEDRLNALEGLGAVPEGHEDVELFYGINTTGNYDVLGKARKQRKFFAKVKEAAKKVGKGIKKVAKALVRYNPLTATIRAAVLLALKVNLFKVASKLKWGYLTESEARAHGFEMSEWQKVKGRLQRAENLFVNTLQGKAENFKRAILSGRAGKLSGPDLGLGVVAAAATAASTTAAVPFITKIINLLKDVNFKKLVANVNIPGLMKNRKQGEDDTPTEEGGSAIPEESADTSSAEAAENSDPGNATELPETDASSALPGAGSNEGDQDPSNESASGDPPEGDTGEASDNEQVEGAGIFQIFKTGVQKFNAVKGKLPVVKRKATDSASSLPVTHMPNTSTAVARQVTTPPAASGTFFTKAFDWIKKNKTTSILVGAGAAFLIYQLAKPKQGLSGAGRGKKRKGKAKKNPPQTISGTGKAKRKPGPKRKGRGKGKGGASKRVKL